jgi:hypothetical protein
MKAGMRVGYISSLVSSIVSNGSGDEFQKSEHAEETSWLQAKPDAASRGDHAGH